MPKGAGPRREGLQAAERTEGVGGLEARGPVCSPGKQVFGSSDIVLLKDLETGPAPGPEENPRSTFPSSPSLLETQVCTLPAPFSLKIQAPPPQTQECVSSVTSSSRPGSLGSQPSSLRPRIQAPHSLLPQSVELGPTLCSLRPRRVQIPITLLPFLPLDSKVWTPVRQRTAPKRRSRVALGTSIAWLWS